MAKASTSGQRIGDWFLWIECEVVKTSSYRKIPVVTVRKAVTGGDILSTVIATPEMVGELRNIADRIENILSEVDERLEDEA